MEPNLFSILFEKHSYSLNPEEETNWVRIYILIGSIGGFIIGFYFGMN